MSRNAGFDEEKLDVLMKYEDTHWWFQYRNKLIVRILKKFGPGQGRLLEIGCGNGLVTEAMATQAPEFEIVGTEFFEAGLDNARKRLPDVTFQQLDARDLTDDTPFDVVCAFDVLEHIDADVDVMKAVRRVMKDADSRFFITVPQHMALWSQADVYAQHERRYSFEEMSEKLSDCGFEVTYRTSYVFLLSPLMFLSRYLKQDGKPYDPEEEFNISGLVNTVFKGIMTCEDLLRKIGLPMPFGGSLVVMAKPK